MTQYVKGVHHDPVLVGCRVYLKSSQQDRLRKNIRIIRLKGQMAKRGQIATKAKQPIKRIMVARVIMLGL